jgi:hypothetical protein
LAGLLDRLDKDIQKIDTLPPTVTQPAMGLEYIESNEHWKASLCIIIGCARGGIISFVANVLRDRHYLSSEELAYVLSPALIPKTDPIDDTWLESDDERSGVIEILLSGGASPNRRVGGESTWEIYEQSRMDKQQGPNEVYYGTYRIIVALLRHGAKIGEPLDHKRLNMTIEQFMELWRLWGGLRVAGSGFKM